MNLTPYHLVVLTSRMSGAYCYIPVCLHNLDRDNFTFSPSLYG